jgi:hypothetical protein
VWARISHERHHLALEFRQHLHIGVPRALMLAIEFIGKALLVAFWPMPKRQLLALLREPTVDIREDGKGILKGRLQIGGIYGGSRIAVGCLPGG